MKKEISTQSAGELAKLLSEKRAALRQFRFDINGSKLKNVKLGKTLRKDIARILTAFTAQRKANAK